MYTSGTNQLAFSSNGAITMRCLGDNSLRVEGQLDLSAAGAGRINFPPSQNASSDANTLDDYEEGTFTPTITFGNGTTGQTYDTRVGYYVKIGKMVHCQLYIYFSAKGSSTGSARITGMPFTSASAGTYASIVCAYHFGMSSIVDGINGYLNINNTTCELLNGSATTMPALTDTNFTNTSEMMYTISYIASA